MGSRIQLAPGSPVPFRQLQYFLVPSTSNYSTLSSWQSIPPSLLQPVGEQFPQPRGINRMHWYGLVIKAPGPGRFLTPQMTFATLHAHDFACAGYMKAGLRPLVSLKFRHLPLL